MTFRARMSAVFEDLELPFLDHNEYAKFSVQEVIFKNFQETWPLTKLPE